MIYFAVPDVGEDEIKEVVDTLKSGWLTTGPKTKEFEKKFAEYVGSKHAIAVSSCTAALHISLVSLGIGPGDEVITTPFTFIATANVILHTGAIPKFVDIKDDFNINEELIDDAVTERTRAIMPVHYSGQPSEMDKIMSIAQRHKLYVIEDAAHAVGAEYKGRKIGTIGDMTAFSFYATKNLTTGEGGMITTNNDEIAEKARILSLHGINKDAWKRYTSEGTWYYEVVYPGFKYNMTDIQASLGLHQLKKIDEFNARREKLAKIYIELLRDVEEIELPIVHGYVKHSWHLFVIKLMIEKLKINRAEFIEELKSRGVLTSVHFIPVHLHPYYKERFGFKRGDFPNAERIYDRVVSLPLHTKLEESDVEFVVKQVKEIISKNRVLT